MRYIDLSDLVILLGLGLVTVGAWWIYPPAGLILLGLGLILFGIALA